MAKIKLTLPVTGSSGGSGGATNLSYTASPTNGTVTSDTGSDATIPLADNINAGLLEPSKYTVLENTSGTNTGDQDLQSVLDNGNVADETTISLNSSTDNLVTVIRPSGVVTIDSDTNYRVGINTDTANDVGGIPFVGFNSVFDNSVIFLYPEDISISNKYKLPSKPSGIHTLATLDDIPTPIDITGKVPYTGATQNVDLGVYNISSAQATAPSHLVTKAQHDTKENVSNKQNSLATDGTGTKYPTVDAVNAAIPASYAVVVYVNTTSPNTATIFDDVNPPVTNDDALKIDTDNLYIGTDASTWVYNGTTYITKTIAPSSNFKIVGTGVDAGSNKTSDITREGSIASEGNISAELGYYVNRNGSNTAQIGGFFNFSNAVGSNSMMWQLNASNGLDLWAYVASTWTKVATFTNVGNLTANNLSGVNTGDQDLQSVLNEGNIEVGSNSTLTISSDIIRLIDNTDSDFITKIEQNQLSVLSPTAQTYIESFGVTATENSKSLHMNSEGFIYVDVLSSEYLMPTKPAGTYTLATLDDIPTPTVGSLEYNNTDKTVWNNGKGNVTSNTSFGDQNLIANTSGVDNTSLGFRALMYLTGLSDKIVALGSNAGRYFGTNSPLTTALGSIFIGYNTRASADNSINETVIGNDVAGAGNNSVTLGNPSVTKTVLRGNVETNGTMLASNLSGTNTGDQQLILPVTETGTSFSLTDAYNGKVVILTASCTVTIPNGLIAGFEVSLITLAGVTLTVALGGSVVLFNNVGTTMAEKSSCTIKNRTATNNYITAGSL